MSARDRDPEPQITLAPARRSPQGFSRVSEERQFRGWRISVVKATFESPDGDTFTRDIVRHPGAVAVVAVTDHETALLVRQYRGSIDRELLEIPAGTRDVEGEPAEATALRELEEEAGVSAGRVRLLGRVYNSPGFCDEETWLFLATDLQSHDAHREGEEERFMEVVEVALGEVDSMIASGVLSDAQTVIGLLMARDVLRGEDTDPE